jgi:hypothetical protein
VAQASAAFFESPPLDDPSDEDEDDESEDDESEDDDSDEPPPSLGDCFDFRP